MKNRAMIAKLSSSKEFLYAQARTLTDRAIGDDDIIPTTQDRDKTYLEESN